MLKNGCCDAYLRKVREVAPAGGQAMEECIASVERGVSFQLTALQMGMGNAYLSYMAWLVAPEAAKEYRRQQGKVAFHLRKLTLTGPEVAAYERLARVHPRIKPFYKAVPAKSPGAVEVSQLDRIEAKLDRLLCSLGETVDAGGGA